MHRDSHSATPGTDQTALALINLSNTPETEIIKERKHGCPRAHVSTKCPRSQKIDKQKGIKYDKGYDNERISWKIYGHYLRIIESYAKLGITVNKPKFKNYH
ncbi:hypothetical protein BROSI_A3703 [Candidatus Brocadia sinica JPN1]|uniref:Uncharacterized protein n=1 Tax=Candidatus Brocadia sinica JPN1 TaxID=1197129 RepID=A0ABQ0K243_9BACT|nr:hypothetical protein BROSI_A3703 [Candidatus Brocadia sinica JPN1]GIK12161.1 MAG: hypothetical protein BroJett002_08680 [Candidatus Brocadia sinica]GJQ17444.1 MAG: hypothetical protein HBSIN01_14030 [Candidatus Brocadia sinica]